MVTLSVRDGAVFEALQDGNGFISHMRCLYPPCGRVTEWLRRDDDRTGAPDAPRSFWLFPLRGREGGAAAFHVKRGGGWVGLGRDVV